jgi:formate-dependent phosphoribosylglycinamide formyltransferase (GAR transformylase)
MNESEILDKIAELSAKVLAHKHMIARLLAHEADNSKHPDVVIAEFSSATTEHIHEIKKMGSRVGPGTIAISDVIQRESDWIVAEARAIRG